MKDIKIKGTDRTLIISVFGIATIIDNYTNKTISRWEADDNTVEWFKETQCENEEHTTETAPAEDPEAVTLAPADMDCVWDENGDIITPDTTTTTEEEKEAIKMTYTITRNEAFNSLEITFDGKPSEAIRDALKALKFRWHGVKKMWYGYSSEDAARAAIEGTKPADGMKPAGQDHIRIYWNGIKIDGGKLIRCFYSLNNDCTINGDCVSISARDYADLPRDLLPVHNDTDIYTDYFDSDRATITPDHPLYKYFRYAALKDRAHDAKRYIDKLQKDLNSDKVNAWRGRREYLEDEIKTHQGYIDAYEAETDPGQPTAADLAAIDQRRQEAENARREAEHAAELAEREKVLNIRNDGRRMIEATAEAHPIADNAPVVTINWSEHPAFYDWDDDVLKLSIPAADHILFALDLKQHNTPESGYFKTKFTITGTDPDGEPINYSGRFDIGDGEGGLINHIRNYGEWFRTHDEFGHIKPEPDEYNDNLRFADFLATYTE